MLYKKVHRQFLREFKKGRKFKVGDDVFKVTGKPYTYIDRNLCGAVWVWVEKNFSISRYRRLLITTEGQLRGRDIEWLG